MGEVVRFRGAAGPVFQIERLPFTGRTGKARERWAVVEYGPDGATEIHGPLRSRAVAETWLDSMRGDEADKRKARQLSPLVAALDKVPAETRREIIRALRSEVERGRLPPIA